MVGFGENQECVTVAPQYLSRRQRHRHCGRSVTDQTMTNSEDVVQSLKSKAQTKNVQTSSPVPENSGQQLFHISSLTTRFGETYRYVANHINSQFSLVSARVQKQETFKTQWKHGKRKSQNISDLSHVKLNNVSSSWEEGYLLFARHINNYFGAKATYEAQKKGDKNLKEIKSYEKQLFTSSNSRNISNPNNFGENNLQTEETKKQFFNSQGQLKNNSRGSFQEVDKRNLKAAGRLKYLSIAEYLRYPTASIPNLLSTFLKTDISSQTIKPKTAVTSPKSTLKKSVSNPVKSDFCPYCSL